MKGSKLLSCLDFVGWFGVFFFAHVGEVEAKSGLLFASSHSRESREPSLRNNTKQNDFKLSPLHNLNFISSLMHYRAKKQ